MQARPGCGVWGLVYAFNLCSHTDLFELNNGLIYRVSFRTAHDTQRNSSLKNKQQKKERKKEKKKKRKEKDKRRRKKKEK